MDGAILGLGHPGTWEQTQAWWQLQQQAGQTLAWAWQNALSTILIGPSRCPRAQSRMSFTLGWPARILSMAGFVGPGQGSVHPSHSHSPAWQAADSAHPQARHPPHGPAQLLVGHVAVLLLLPPQLGHSLGTQELEDALMPVLPLHEALIELWVDEDVPDKFPQVGAPGSCKGHMPVISQQSRGQAPGPSPCWPMPRAWCRPSQQAQPCPHFRPTVTGWGAGEATSPL